MSVNSYIARQFGKPTGLGGKIVTSIVDAIVNAANTSLQMGGGACGAMFSAAGADRLQTACNNLLYCSP